MFNDLVSETHPCEECKKFQENAGGNFPICLKHLAAVEAGMHVVYSAKDGSCFEERKDGNGLSKGG